MGEVAEEVANFRSEISLLQHSDADFKPPLSPLSAFINIPSISEDHHHSNTNDPIDTWPVNENDPDFKDEWLPITESRHGNAYYAAFHILNSNIGFQALMLPVAFATLGWAGGITCLSVAFVWQLYTIILLLQLHESVPGVRYSRYLFLAMVAFGKRVGKVAAIFPVMYLSGGSCVMLIITGGGTMKLLLKTICENDQTCDAHSLSGTEWFLVFTFIAILMAQFPNLNSIAGVSLIGGITAICYCTLFWVLSVKKGRPARVSYTSSVEGNSHVAKLSDISNAIGIIVLAFRGHNVLLEIQGTLPSDAKHPSKEPMSKGVTISYSLIAMCLFPLAIAGFWAYGNQIPSGGMLTAFPHFHKHQVTKFTMATMYMLIIIHCLCSFQVYAMPVFDNLEIRYVSIKKERCPRWVRTAFRIFFGGLTFFISVAFPFLPSLAALLGGMTLVPVTYAYPCFMWIAIKKPPTKGAVWCFNVALGCFGMALGALVAVAALWTLVVDKTLNANFFKP